MKKNPGKQNTKKTKNKNTRKKTLAVFVTALIFTVLFFMYGPYKGLSDLWIITAMHTSESRFLAKMFYTDTHIEKVLAKNRVLIDSGSTDGDKIQFPGDNVTDKILTHNISGKNYRGYVMEITNPARMHLAPAKDSQGEKLEEIVIRNAALGGVNASGYKALETPGIADGFSIVDGETISRCDKDSHRIGGLDNNNRLIVGKMTEDEIENCSFRWAVEAGPVLIINGTPIEMTNIAGGIAPRTAIGQKKDGTILIVVIDGRQLSSVGAFLQDVQSVLLEYGAINAINLDGGSSTSFFYKGALVNSPSKGEKHREIPNAILIK